MEIGSKLDRSIVDIETEYRKYSLAYLLVILAVVGVFIYFILNRTHFTEQIIFNKIAILKKFSIEYTDNYTILTSKKDNIQVWFRYDEKFDTKKENKIYLTGKYTKPSINSEHEILLNLDNMFNTQKQKRLGLPYRGEYDITFIGDNILKYKSDLPVNDRTTLLEIIEKTPIDTTYMVFRDNATVSTEDFVKLYGGSKDKILWGKIDILSINSNKVIINRQKEFNTYTEIILIDGNGIILGTCENSSNTINKLDDIMQELYVVSLLEGTSIF